MKKLIVGITLLTLFLWVGNAWAPPPLPPKPYLDTNCNQSKYFPLGSLCQDTDDGKLYKGTGAAVVEIAAGGAGDMTLAAFDADLDGKIDAAAGGTNITTAASTGTAYVTGGTWSIKSAADEMTALGFTANAQTLIGETFAQMQASLSIDDLITLSGVAEGAVNLGTFPGTTITDNQTIKVALQLLETAVETKQTTDATITALAGLTISDVSIIEGTGADAFNVVASGGNNYFLGSNAGNTALEFKTPAATLTAIGGQATHANLTALSPAGNWKMFYSNGTGVITEVALDVAGTVLTSNGVAAAPTMQAPAGTGDVQSVGDCSSGACGDGTSDGGSYIELYAAAGNTRLVDTAGTLEIKTAAGAAYAPIKVEALTATGTTTLAAALTGIAKLTSGVVSVATLGTDIPGLASANTFTGNNVFGDADTDTFTVRSLIVGGNSRAVWIAGSAPTPSYATATNELYVAGDIESAGTIYGAGFQSILAPGNTGYVRINEDPANGTNFRGISVVSNLTEDLTFTLPTGNPAANDLFIIGAPSLNVSLITYSSLPTLMDTVLGNTRGSILYRGASGWTILTPGTSGHALLSQGAGADPHYAAVTAAAAGAATNIQYNTGGALDAEAAFTYDAATNTLNVTVNGANPGITVGDGTYTMGHTPQVYVEGILEVDGVLYADGGITGTLTGSASALAVASQAVGDLFYADSGTTIVRLADVAAGQPLLSGGLVTAPAYAGYTFVGTAAQTYTFPSVTSTLVPVADAVMTGSFQLPNGANPTTDAGGEVAVDTSSGAGGGIRIYTNATPGAVTIPIYMVGPPITIKDPTSSSDYPVMYTPYAITIKAVHYLCIGGTSWTGQLQQCDANGANCTDTQAVDTTASAGTTTNVTTFSDAAIPTSVWFGLKTTSVSGAPTSINVSFEYTVDQVN